MSIVLLLAAAAAMALLFVRVGAPGGLVVGAMIGAGGFSLLRGGAAVAVPGPLRTAALITLGASIGATLTRETVVGLRVVVLPAILAALLIILAGVAIAYLLRAFGLAPDGAVLATSPGALSTVVAVAAERGNGAEVALFHTVRVILVLLSLPALLALLPDTGG